MPDPRQPEPERPMSTPTWKPVIDDPDDNELSMKSAIQIPMRTGSHHNVLGDPPIPFKKRTRSLSHSRSCAGPIADTNPALILKTMAKRLWATGESRIPLPRVPNTTGWRTCRRIPNHKKQIGSAIGFGIMSGT